MATFIERPAEDENEEYETLENTEEELIEETQEETPEQPPEDDLPEKYRNKDVHEIARMHQEAEQLIGRQSSEVGELRRIVDDFVKTQLEQQKQSPQAQQEPEVDFFDDPDAYIDRKLQSHPKIKEAEQYTTQARYSSVMNQLESKHPDYQQIIQDQKFAEWVLGSKIRQQLYYRADKEFDFDSADELLTLWKERQQVVKQTEEVQKQDRKNQAKAASTGSAKGSGEPSSRKVYRRADIIELMRKDPKRYSQLSDEILKAYAENRVK